MRKLITVFCVSAVLVSCGGSGSQTDTMNAGQTFGAAMPDAVDTGTLMVDQNFAFPTSRKIEVDFDVEGARNADADVSICTDFATDNQNYDVNFNSCTASGKLVDGVFQHTIDVTNDNDSVVGVILFQDSSIAPMYKEFSVDNRMRAKGDGDTRQVLVWQ